MKPMVTVSLVAVFAFSGCSMMNMGHDLGSGLGEGLSDKADTIGSSLVRGARDTLTSVETRKQLDTLLAGIGQTLSEQARRTRDTILGDATRAWVQKLRDSLMGARTLEQLAAIRNELLGVSTRKNLAALRTELLGDSTQRLVGAMRSQLLGPDTKAEVASLIDTAMVRLAARFGTNLKPLLDQELSYVQRNASTLLIVLGAVACGIIGFIYYQKNKTLKLIKALTFQIHEIPDQNAYDELVARIRRTAQESGLEPQLRKILQEQGILGEEAWRKAA